MPAFEIGDMVEIHLLKGYTKHGVPSVSMLYVTWPEARFDGAKGRVTEIDPLGTRGVPAYLVDFHGIDQGRKAIPWQSEWFRAEWLKLIEPAEGSDDGERVRSAVEAARKESLSTSEPTEHSVDHAAQVFVAAMTPLKGVLQVAATRTCPADYPIKAKARARHYFLPDHAAYDAVIPEFCFESEESALESGFRPADPNAQ